MGTIHHAHLYYGYALGSEDAGLDVAEAKQSETNRYGYLKTSYYDAEIVFDDDEEEDRDLMEILTKRLVDAIDPDLLDDEDRERIGHSPEYAIKKHLGVELEYIGNSEYPSYVLSAGEGAKAYGGEANVVDVAALAADPIAGKWDDRLAEALRILELTPDQAQPAWLIAPSWG